MRALTALVPIAASVACLDLPDQRAEALFRCQSSSDCLADFQCVSGYCCTPEAAEQCVERNPDAGPPPRVTLSEFAFVRQGDLRTPGGQSRFCSEVECPAGMVALAGGGNVHDKNAPVFQGRANPRTWRQCLVGRTAATPPDTVNLDVLCVQAPSSSIVTRSKDFEVGSGASVGFLACEPGEVLLGGGGGWPDGWRPTVQRVVTSTATGDEPVWLIRGFGPAGTLSVQAFCGTVTNTPRPIVSQSAEVGGDLGEGCADVTCPAGHLVSGGAEVPSEIHPATSQPGSLNQWLICGQNESTRPLSITAFALCVD